MSTKTISTQGFVIACMKCHNGKPEAIDTLEEAQRQAQIHFSVTEKPHGGHTVAIIPATLVRTKKA